MVSFIQLGKLYLEREEYGKLQKILRQLHQSCQVRRSLFLLLSVCEVNFFVLLWLYLHCLNAIIEQNECFFLENWIVYAFMFICRKDHKSVHVLFIVVVTLLVIVCFFMVQCTRVLLSHYVFSL